MMDQLTRLDRGKRLLLSAPWNSRIPANASAFAVYHQAGHARNHCPKGGVEIGWRLAPEYWGNGYVTEAAFRCWLEYGFNIWSLKEIVSFAVCWQPTLPSR